MSSVCIKVVATLYELYASPVMSRWTVWNGQVPDLYIFQPSLPARETSMKSTSLRICGTQYKKATKPRVPKRQEISTQSIVLCCMNRSESSPEVVRREAGRSDRCNLGRTKVSPVRLAHAGQRSAPIHVQQRKQTCTTRAGFYEPPHIVHRHLLHA